MRCALRSTILTGLLVALGGCCSVLAADGGEGGEVWKPATATVFWVGERESEDNGYIANRAGAWDERWLLHFGGVDSPQSRCGFLPCGFTPRENPFYVALPYDDTEGSSKQHAARSALKNSWVAVRSGDRVCYGQWEDVGPFETTDYAYVFGSALQPKNRRDVRAGIDISPALKSCLGVGDVAQVEWRLVPAAAVPNGPWRSIITKRPGPQ